MFTSSLHGMIALRGGEWGYASTRHFTWDCGAFRIICSVSKAERLQLGPTAGNLVPLMKEFTYDPDILLTPDEKPFP